MLGLLWCKLTEKLAHLQGCVGAAEQGEDLCPFLQTIAAIGIELMGAAKARFRVGGTIELTQQAGEFPVRLDPAGLECHRLLIADGGLSEVTLPSQRVAKTVVRLGECRLERNRPPIVMDGLVGAPQVQKDVAEIVVGFGITGPQTERSSKLSLCLLEFALLPQRIAEIIVGFGMVGIES